MQRRILPIFLLSFVLLFAWNNEARAQSEADNVRKTIEIIFDGMRAGDSAKIHSVISDAVVMQTIGRDQSGQPVVRSGSLQGWLNSIGTPHEQVYDEQILDYKIQVDGPMATAWTPYKFYVGDKFSHCGVNSFQLFKEGDTWKVIYLIDTRRRDNCE